MRDAAGKEIRSARGMAELQADVFAGRINPKDIVTVREVLTSPTPGRDTAVFSGIRSAYAITPVDGGLIVSGPDGNDTVRNVEQLKFADETVDVADLQAFFGVSAFAGDAQATVLFTVPATIGGAAVTGLVLSRTDAAGTVLTDLPAGTRSLVVTGLTNGTPVTFQVRALTAGGPGDLSPMSATVTPQVSGGSEDSGSGGSGGSARLRHRGGRLRRLRRLGRLRHRGGRLRRLGWVGHRLGRLRKRR